MNHQELEQPQGGNMQETQPELSWKRSKLDLPTQIKDATGRLIAVAMVSSGKFGVSQSEAETNACLIAAAPDLLEALDDMLAMIYEGVPKEEWPAIQAKAKAAIVKARASTATE